MNNCSTISAALVAAVCNKQEQGGTAARVILINFKDIDKSLSIASKTTISEIVLQPFKRGYAFTSLEDSTVGDFAVNKGTWFRNWNHNLLLRIFIKSDYAKEFVNAIAGSRVVAIVENKEIGSAIVVGGVATEGEVKYEVYGWDAGLELQEAVGTTDIADGVVYDLKLGTPEKSKESSIPKSIFNSDIYTTENMIDSLIGS